ncbi:hypothetical protein LIER_28181 [Lithospermum erythrorhizon]|uniref:Uncharacterized protein n=1 Tax=Lithospermum erythrorhizon TaxID=34254 RepID=A0AAV3RII5_LITER
MVKKLVPGPQASHETSRLWLREWLKVVALEQELKGRSLQATEAIHHPWELALLGQDLRKAKEERAAAFRAARAAQQKMEGLRRAYCQDSPLRCRI